jgi:phosphatidylglycerophosphate synthase
LNGRHNPTIAQIAAEYRDNKLNEELRGNWVIALVNRLPSFPLIWLFARLGASPTTVTVGGAAIAVALVPVALWVPLWLAGPLVFFLGWLYQVADCVDGGLARITDSGSEFGAEVDFLVDMAQWGLLYIALGLLADRHGGSLGDFTAIAAAAAWLRLYVVLFRYFAVSKAHVHDNRPLRLVEIPVAFFAGLSGAIPFMALLGPFLALAVPLLLAYSILDLLDAGLASLRRRYE